MSHQLAKFGGNMQCCSGAMFLVCHVIKESCDFMVGSISRQVTILQNLVAIATLVVETLLVCQAIS